MSEEKRAIPRLLPRILHGIGDALEKVINFAASVLLVVITIAVVVQVFGRSFNIPVVWLGELSTYSTIWAVFLGLAIGYKHGLFAQVDIICHVAPKSWTKYLSIFWEIAALVIMGIILWSSRDYIAHVMKSRTLSSELRVPLYYVYMGPITGYIFTSYYCIVNLVDKLYALIDGKPDPRIDAVTAELGRA